MARFKSNRFKVVKPLLGIGPMTTQYVRQTKNDSMPSGTLKALTQQYKVKPMSERIKAIKSKTPNTSFRSGAIVSPLQRTSAKVSKSRVGVQTGQPSASTLSSRAYAKLAKEAAQAKVRAKIKKLKTSPSGAVVVRRAFLAKVSRSGINTRTKSYKSFKNRFKRTLNTAKYKFTAARRKALAKAQRVAAAARRKIKRGVSKFKTKFSRNK